MKKKNIEKYLKIGRWENKNCLGKGHVRMKLLNKLYYDMKV